MRLSKRLRSIVSMVDFQNVAADVGCDHGFTAIEIIKSGKANRVLATDINKEPLNRALKHIRQAELDDKIQVRLSDGLKNIRPYEADVLIISGMGGGLIKRILEEKKDVSMCFKEMILSPQSEIYKVRYTLHELGYSIIKEKMIFDMGKYYTIIKAVPGQEKYLSTREYMYGKCLMDEMSDVFLDFMENEKKRLEIIINKYPKYADEKELNRLDSELKEVNEILLLRNGGL